MAAVGGGLEANGDGGDGGGRADGKISWPAFVLDRAGGGLVLGDGGGVRTAATAGGGMRDFEKKDEAGARWMGDGTSDGGGNGDECCERVVVDAAAVDSTKLTGTIEELLCVSAGGATHESVTLDVRPSSRKKAPAPMADMPTARKTQVLQRVQALSSLASVAWPSSSPSLANESSVQMRCPRCADPVLRITSAI